MCYKKLYQKLTVATITFGAMGSLFADAASNPTPSNQTSHPSDPYYYSPTSKEFFVYAEWIYWKPMTADPMNWADKQAYQSSVTPSTQEETNDVRSLKYDFSSGFRVGAGYRFARDTFGTDIRPWQIEAEYTRLHTATSAHASSGGPVENSTFTESNAVVPELPTTNSLTFGELVGALNAHSRSSLEYDRLDLKFAWPIWMRSNVVLRLMTGATFAWFENNWSNYFTGDVQGTFPAIPAKSQTKLDWKWWGGGLMGGGDIYVAVGKGFGFFADSSLGLLFGPMHQKESYNETDDATVFNKMRAKYSPYTFQPVVNFRAGLDYKHWFKEMVMLHMALGWEFTWWFDMNQFGRVNQRTLGIPQPGVYFNTKATDLGYQGLTARLGFDF